MNITVENLAPCKKLLRVELDAKSVDETFDAITKDYQKQASLPGFRPGKAPRDLVIKKYEADIQSDARRKLIGESYRKALEEKKISVISQPDIEEIQFGRGQNLQFAATIETAPEFQLPEYKGLTVKREIKSVTDEDVERALNLLAQQQTKFETVARRIEDGRCRRGELHRHVRRQTDHGNRADGERPDGTEKFLGGHGAEHVHRRFCGSAHRREGRRHSARSMWIFPLIL